MIVQELIVSKVLTFLLAREMNFQQLNKLILFMNQFSENNYTIFINAALRTLNNFFLRDQIVTPKVTTDSMQVNYNATQGSGPGGAY